MPLYRPCLKFLVLLSGLFIFNPSFANTQHKPLTSPLNSAVSTGFIFEPSVGKKPFFSKKGGVFLNYTYYFSSWDNRLPKKYQGYLDWGLRGGTGFFFPSRNFCTDTPYHKPLLAQAGVQLRVVHWEYFQPFVGGDLNHLFCYRKLKDVQSSMKLDYGFSFGFSLSLKVLDRSAIYSLDEDYGLNDLVLAAQCFHLKKVSDSDKRIICQVGLEALF